jgi:hypothetical protein
MSADYRVHHDLFGRLVLTDAQGVAHVGAEAVRAFPISDADFGVSICNAEGGELVWIEDLTAIPAETRQVIIDDLRYREFLPVVRRIVSVSAWQDPCEWVVDTDRGRVCFVLRSEDDVQRLGSHQTLIVDSHGGRYLVADRRALDAASRRYLDRYL